MGWLNKAIDEGVREGFEGALIGICDGADDPDERCCMNPADGCLCIWARWSKLPWWRRMLITEPVRPTRDAVLTSYIRQRVWLAAAPQENRHGE